MTDHFWCKGLSAPWRQAGGQRVVHHLLARSWQGWRHGLLWCDDGSTAESLDLGSISSDAHLRLLPQHQVLWRRQHLQNLHQELCHAGVRSGHQHLLLQEEGASWEGSRCWALIDLPKLRGISTSRWSCSNHFKKDFGPIQKLFFYLLSLLLFTEHWKMLNLGLFSEPE